MNLRLLPAPSFGPLARPCGKAIHQASAVRSHLIAFRIAANPPAKCDARGGINVFQFQIDKNPFLHFEAISNSRLPLDGAPAWNVLSIWNWNTLIPPLASHFAGGL